MDACPPGTQRWVRNTAWPGRAVGASPCPRWRPDAGSLLPRPGTETSQSPSPDPSTQLPLQVQDVHWALNRAKAALAGTPGGHPPTPTPSPYPPAAPAPPCPVSLSLIACQAPAQPPPGLAVASRALVQALPVWAAAPGPLRTDLHSGPTPPRPVPDSALPPPVVSVGPSPGAGRLRGRGGREPRRLPAPPCPALAAASAAGHTAPRKRKGGGGWERMAQKRAVCPGHSPGPRQRPGGQPKGAWGALLQGRAVGSAVGREGLGAQNLRKGRRAI